MDNLTIIWVRFWVSYFGIILISIPTMIKTGWIDGWEKYVISFGVALFSMALSIQKDK